MIGVKYLSRKQSQYRWSELIVWGRISIDGCTDFHVNWNVLLTNQMYADEIFRLISYGMTWDFSTFNDSAKPHIANMLETEITQCMEWPARSLDFNYNDAFMRNICIRWQSVIWRLYCLWNVQNTSKCYGQSLRIYAKQKFAIDLAVRGEHMPYKKIFIFFEPIFFSLLRLSNWCLRTLCYVVDIN